VVIVLLAIVLGRHLMNKPVEEANRAGRGAGGGADQIRESE